MMILINRKDFIIIQLFLLIIRRYILKDSKGGRPQTDLVASIHSDRHWVGF